VHSCVTWDGETALDHILSRTPVPVRFDVLSIDVDGNDFHILEALGVYRPTVVCIEFNPSIPNAVHYVQPRDERISRGASIKAIAAMASGKGYAVVAATYCNLFLLDRACLAAVGLSREPTLDEVRDDAHARTYLFCGYDGTVMLSQPMVMPWHGLTVADADVQVLPPVLRRYPPDYTFAQKVGAFVFRKIRRWRRR
jgi:hypothetical protein